MHQKTKRIFSSKTPLIIVLLFFAIVFASPHVHGRKRKFKGVVIVNQILKLGGTATANGNPVPEFSGVKEGDVLETAEKSFAMVRIPGLGIFRLGPSTKVKLTKFSNRDTTKLELIKGELLSIYKRLGQHEIKLPNAEIFPNGNSNSNTLVAVVGDKNLVALWDGKAEIKWVAPQMASSVNLPPPAAAVSAVPGKTPEIIADPTAPPVLPTLQEKTLTSKESYKKVVIGTQGLEEKDENSPSLPDLKIIQEMESLYSLP